MSMLVSSSRAGQGELDKRVIGAVAIMVGEIQEKKGKRKEKKKKKKGGARMLTSS